MSEIEEIKEFRDNFVIPAGYGEDTLRLSRMLHYIDYLLTALDESEKRVKYLVARINELLVSYKEQISYSFEEEMQEVLKEVKEPK